MAVWRALVLGLRLGAAASLAHSQLLEDNLGRTKPGERGLDQVHPDKGGQEKPLGADEVGEGEARENHGSGEHADDAFGFHAYMRICSCMDMQGEICSNRRMAKKNLAAPDSSAMTDEALELIAARFRILGEPSRLKLIRALEPGEKSVSELMEACGLTQANTSRHLQSLTQAGILGRRKEGLNVIYFIADPGIFELCHHVCGSLQNHLSRHAKAFGS